MPSTPVLGLPYPLSTDTADVPRDLQALAVKLDTVVPAAAAGSATVSGQVSDVGQPGQMRAGRQLSASDFTSLGLSAPRGLWNLSDLTDVSGNGRNLTNKGAVSFGPGINGSPATAAQFAGSTGQALYISDTGAADPFRITSGSWGAWFRTAKRGTGQDVLTKDGATPQRGYLLLVNGNNVVQFAYSYDGTNTVNVVGVSDVSDDRWHFVVATVDGTILRLYVDGVLEATLATGVTVFGPTAPLNIGAASADGATAAQSPHYGRVDEAFVSADVLTDDQVRALYAARLTHTLGATPKRVSLNVRRQRRGAALIPGDFTTTPVRLYNFAAGALADQGSNNVPVANAGTAPILVTGADGTVANALSFGATATAHLMSTDAGLPSALLPRSYGCWLKAPATVGEAVLGWGTLATADARLTLGNGGPLTASSGGDSIVGPVVTDGQWHSAIVVEDNAAADGVKRKLYLDGRLVGGSTVMNTLTLAGVARFRIGANPDGSAPFVGQLDGVFVCGYAMTTDEVLRLYAKSGQSLAPSPKNAGDHVEGFDSGSLLFIGDTLDAPHSIDLTVS